MRHTRAARSRRGCASASVCMGDVARPAAPRARTARAAGAAAGRPPARTPRRAEARGRRRAESSARPRPRARRRTRPSRVQVPFLVSVVSESRRAPSPRDERVVRRGVACGTDARGVREAAQLLHRARRVIRTPGTERRREYRRLAPLAAGAYDAVVDADAGQTLEHVVHGAVRVRGDEHGLRCPRARARSRPASRTSPRRGKPGSARNRALPAPRAPRPSARR